MVNKRDDLFTKLNNLVSHDEVMVRCIFGRDALALDDKTDFRECLKESFKPIGWMGNILTLAGIFLFTKFNKWRKQSGAAGEGVPNALYLKRLLTGLADAKEFFQFPAPAIRVLRVLDGLYDCFDMNFHVNKYILVNSQYEAGFNTTRRKKGGLCKMLGFPSEDSFVLACDIEDDFRVDGQNLAAAFNMVSMCRNDPNLQATFDTAKYKLEDIMCALDDVLETTEFLKRVRLEIDEEGCVNFIENGEKILSHGVIRAFERTDEEEYKVYTSGMNLPSDFVLDFFVLDNMQYILSDLAAGAALAMSYMCFDEKNSLSVCICEKDNFPAEDFDIKIVRKQSASDYCKDISGYLPGLRAKSSFFRGMISTHYRYHNILAPSIVDAIDDDREAKCRILQRLVKKDETIFEETLAPFFENQRYYGDGILPVAWEDKIERLCDFIRNSDSKSYKAVVDWDTLTARILIYEGPTELIRTALLHDNVYDKDDEERIDEVCRQIIAGLEIRYIDSIFCAKAVAEKQKEIYNIFESGVDHLKSLFPGDTYITKLECKALAQSYIDAIVKTLTKIGEEDDLLGKRPKNNKFAENSIYDRLEILKSCLGDNKIEKFSKNAEKAFVQTILAFLSFYGGIYHCCQARISYEFEKSANILSPLKLEKYKIDIEEKFISGVRETAVALVEKFNHKNAVKMALKELWDFAHLPPEKAKYYYAVFGRKQINAVKLAKIYGIQGDNVFFINPLGDGENYSYDDLAAEARYVGCLYNVVNFLVGNNTTKGFGAKGKGDYSVYKEFVKKIVYPQVVTFAKHHEDCDSNDSLIMDHSGAFASLHDGEVHILTEFIYKINHAYYALPNVNRAETEWWVDPFLISCYLFDEEIRKALGGKTNENT